MMFALLMFHIVLHVVLTLDSNRFRNLFRFFVNYPNRLGNFLLEHWLGFRFLQKISDNKISGKAPSQLTAMLFGSLASFLHGSVDFGSGGGSLKITLYVNRS